MSKIGMLKERPAPISKLVFICVPHAASLIDEVLVPKLAPRLSVGRFWALAILIFNSDASMASCAAFNSGLQLMAWA